jgi:mono/diheme cytochrome c family protein
MKNRRNSDDVQAQSINPRGGWRKGRSGDKHRPRRQAGIILTVLLIILGIVAVLHTTQVFAGGWAVITLDSLPSEVNSSEEFTVGFVVRQHGVSPMVGLSPLVSVTHQASGTQVTFDAKPSGESGHYQAVMSLPKTGIWKWRIQAFTMDMPMPDMMVQEPPSNQNSNFSGLPRDLMMTIAVLVGAVAAGAWLRGSKALAGVVALLLVILGAGAILWSAGGKEAPNPGFSNASSPDSKTRGEELFLAKGCITCHFQQDVQASYENDLGGFGSLGIGPNLSNYQNGAEFLSQWLSDPHSIRPDTVMPRLSLTQAEIADLIVFINSD